MRSDVHVERVPVTTYKEEKTLDVYGVTFDDAHALIEIMRNIAGKPEGPRGAADRLQAALLTGLAKAGVQHITRHQMDFGYPPLALKPQREKYHNYDGSIHFKS